VFKDDFKTTIGVQFHTQKICHASHNIAITLWDLGGQKQFRFMHDAYLKGASGAFACFDLSAPETLAPTREWIDMFRSAIPGIPVLLVGTKFDLVDPDLGIIDPNEYNDLVVAANLLTLEKDLIGFVMTSAKDGTGVDDAIRAMIDILTCNIDCVEYE
jgi:small GTP-binding protein